MKGGDGKSLDTFEKELEKQIKMPQIQSRISYIKDNLEFNPSNEDQFKKFIMGNQPDRPGNFLKFKNTTNPEEINDIFNSELSKLVDIKTFHEKSYDCSDVDYSTNSGSENKKQTLGTRLVKCIRLGKNKAQCVEQQQKEKDCKNFMNDIKGSIQNPTTTLVGNNFLLIMKKFGLKKSAYSYIITYIENQFKSQQENKYFDIFLYNLILMKSPDSTLQDTNTNELLQDSEFVKFLIEKKRPIIVTLFTSGLIGELVDYILDIEKGKGDKVFSKVEFEEKLKYTFGDNTSMKLEINDIGVDDLSIIHCFVKPMSKNINH